MQDIWWNRLKAEIIDTDLETQCGTAVGVSEGTLTYTEKNGVLTLTRTSNPNPVPQAAYQGCPAKDCNYPELNQFVFGKQPENYLSGVVEKAYIGHASDETIRRKGASGGVISQTLIHLLETKQITGAICLQMGAEVPWQAKPVIARTPEEVLACAQSVYSVTPVNTILSELDPSDGPLAYVGLPDQVAGIRKLQQLGHPAVQNIKYILGPYMGTQMTFGAIRSFLRSHGVKNEQEIAHLQYRAGEWPGYLQINLQDGRILKAEKFYYNYLIPFFITRSSLQLVDFTNELTDMSVGDAWSPKYESKRGGHSVILARSLQVVALLEDMKDKITLEEISVEQALDMHGHMLDFKKRGSFIRNSWRKAQPYYGYKPTNIPASRILIERVMSSFFWIGRQPLSHWIIEHVPLSVIGPSFNWLRKTWKSMSKPTKRKGLREQQFTVSSVV